ncbi:MULTISPECIES: hypothetical protein [Pseudomonas]|uniref:HEPN AbiU2-like domain-containing protein n=1 Tax=Pseudomonas juntendi TaxID=2666183 RepID=A0ABD4YE12_9PSED|nr:MULTISPECIES: hypothetical protein [Pseudomonas]MBA6121623.1 hypothetical protein [Pseudomonas juntendi]MBR7521812.1 hypothetical protein [Pseudomonas juntendi]MCF3155428.1 hypothetical protein [Pseudomonas juntendi]MCI0911128.1 hypothetical protein [Pseudomonas putida]MCQ1990050.1 hypothetical protein [Pseudomonas sp. Eb3]
MSRSRKAVASPVIQLDELLQNAVDSICLGVEDYELSATPGKERRAISAARNFYSGVLLLFKYRIGSLASTPEQVVELLHKPIKIQPHRNSGGLLEWRPTPHPKETIDTGMIEARLQELKIFHDWNVVKKLRDCRNDLEHFHPKAPTTEIQRLIVDLFPMLQRFIHEELSDSPSDLLGTAWDSMVAVSEFYERTQSEAAKKWQAAGLPDTAWPFLSTCQCESCYSSLLQPLKSSIDAGFTPDVMEFEYECISCRNTGSVVQLFEEEFSIAREDHYSDGVLIRTCDNCYITAFSMVDEHCHWCGKYDRWPRCAICNAPVSEHTRNAGGNWCDRCDADEYMFRNS